MIIRKRRVRCLFHCACVVAVAAGLVTLLADPRPPRAFPSPARHLPVHYWAHIMANWEHPKWSGCVKPPFSEEIIFDTPFWQRLALPPELGRQDINRDRPGFDGDKTVGDKEDRSKRRYRNFSESSAEERSKLSKILVHSAHWDERAAPSVRVLLYSENTLPRLFCHLWYYWRLSSDLVPAVELQGATGGARMITCALPDAAVPAAVSVSERACGRLYTMLKVQGAPEASVTIWRQQPQLSNLHEGTGVAVCAVWRERGAGRGAGDAARLDQWLRAMDRVNVTAVYLYLGQVSKDVFAIADAWKSLLCVVPYFKPELSAHSNKDGGTTPSPHFPVHNATSKGSVRGPWSLGVDAVALTDCLLRARGLHRWVIQMDVDHYVVPVTSRNWRLLRSSRAAVQRLQRYWFPQWLQPAPERAHVLSSYTQRAPAALPQEGGGYAMLRPSRVLAAAGFPRAVCARAACAERPVPPSHTRLHYYPDRCEPRSRGYCRRIRKTAVRDMTAAWLTAPIQVTL